MWLFIILRKKDQYIKISIRAQRFMQQKIVLKNINKDMSSAIGNAVRILMIEYKSFIFVVLRNVCLYGGVVVLCFTITRSIEHWIGDRKWVICSFMKKFFLFMLRRKISQECVKLVYKYSWVFGKKSTNNINETIYKNQDKSNYDKSIIYPCTLTKKELRFQ